MKGKVILITGGTGSFGRWLTTELLKCDVKEIRIYSRDEEKQIDMRREIPDSRVRYLLGDVRDHVRVLEASEGVDLLYHAAALKIISICERDPLEAIKTNVLGTWNVKRAAIENRIEKSLLISTDKAVKPINVYGMTKAIAERCWISDGGHSQSKFAVVRYGNVLGSRGSVVPLFRMLIGQKTRLPVTDPRMTRFVITLKEATEFVFYATENMKGGEIYVPNIPACTILDLAGAIGGRNYPTEVVGVRSPEKTHEVLVAEHELQRTETIGEYYVIHPYGEWASGDMTEEFTTQNTQKLNLEQLRYLLQQAGLL